MPDFVILPEADHSTDPNDWSNAVFALGVTSPATVTGLTNGTSYVAIELLRAPASPAFMPSAVSSLTATSLGLSETAFGATPTFTLNLAGYGSGDRLVLVLATNSTAAASSVTVGGQPAGADLANTGNSLAGARIYVYEYTLTGSETFTTDVVFTFGGGQAANVLGAVVVSGGTRDNVAVKTIAIANETSIAGTVTPSTENNVIVAVGIGRASLFGSHSWTNATQEGATFVGMDRSGAIALATDVSIGAYSVTFNADARASTSDEAALALLAYSA